MFFLGFGSLALVLLRRFGVRLSLPIEEALLHEFAGWIALAGGVIKSRYRPGAEGLLGISWGLWVGLAFRVPAGVPRRPHVAACAARTPAEVVPAEGWRARCV